MSFLPKLKITYEHSMGTDHRSLAFTSEQYKFLSTMPYPTNSPRLHFAPKSQNQPGSTTTDNKSFRKKPGERSYNEELSSPRKLMFDKRQMDAAWAHKRVFMSGDAELCIEFVQTLIVQDRVGYLEGIDFMVEFTRKRLNLAVDDELGEEPNTIVASEEASGFVTVRGGFGHSR